MVAAEVDPYQSAVGRVTSLPLVSSTYGLVCSVYCGARDHHPYLRSVCHAAEQGVRAITAVAMTTAMPIIGKLEPQLAIANELACKGLDQIEKTLPILHQPSDQIVANAKDAVSSATGVVTVARATVSGRLNGAVDRTKAAVSGGVDRVLSTSEDLMARYLPPGSEEEEREPESCEATRGSDEPSYYVRLGSLSTRIRRRAYSRAQARVSEARRRSLEAISQLPHTVDLIEYARKNIDGANRKVYGALSSLVEAETSSPALEETAGHQTEAGESGTLARSLTHQLQTTCITLASGLQGFSRHLQQEARSLGRSASSAYATVAKVAAAEGTLAGGRARLGQMKQSLDNVLDYLVNNTPLNWLVGPFYPHLNAATPPSRPQVTAPPTQASSPEPAQSPSSQQAACCPEPSCCSAVSHQQEVCEEEMLTMVSQHAV